MLIPVRVRDTLLSDMGGGGGQAVGAELEHVELSYTLLLRQTRIGVRLNTDKECLS